MSYEDLLYLTFILVSLIGYKVADTASSLSNKPHSSSSLTPLNIDSYHLVSPCYHDKHYFVCPGNDAKIIMEK